MSKTSKQAGERAQCQGHPAGEFDPIGQTVFCDGSCNKIRFDYEKQVWIKDGLFVRCGHPDSMKCNCYGKTHEGEVEAGSDVRFICGTVFDVTQTEETQQNNSGKKSRTRLSAGESSRRIPLTDSMISVNRLLAGVQKLESTRIR